jgi:hypothetical protein
MHPHIQTLRATKFMTVIEYGRTKPWVVYCETLTGDSAGVLSRKGKGNAGVN